MKEKFMALSTRRKVLLVAMGILLLLILAVLPGKKEVKEPVETAPEDQSENSRIAKEAGQHRNGLDEFILLLITAKICK